jgi:hypothetical protein
MLGRIFTVGGYNAYLAADRIRARHHARRDSRRRARRGRVFRGAAPANHFRAIFAEGALQRRIRFRPMRI